MRQIFTFLVLIASISAVAAYLPPQYNPDQLYNEEGLAYFMVGLSYNDINNMSILDMTGFGYAYHEIFDQLKKDGVGAKGFASGHYVSERQYQVQGLTLEPIDNSTPISAGWYGGKQWIDAYVPIPQSVAG